MPILRSTFSPPYLFRNGHISTIYPNLLRKVRGVLQERERVELQDGDFIDLDWSYASTKESKKLAIIIHGLEGNGQRQYIIGLVKHLTANGWNCVAINLRNCSGEINRLYRSYYGGASEDLDLIVTHILKNHPYNHISLCGFSLGGNILLKYLGENRTIPSQIKSAVGVSVPCDLYNSLSEISKPHNYIYQQRFLKHLKAKLYERQAQFPEYLKKIDIKKCSSLIDIDNLYTSKAHGFKDAIDYYTQCSCKQFLYDIKTPTLILNAKNDSFLGVQCYPTIEAEKSKTLFLEVSEYGGHVGFYLPKNIYYNEQRTLQFFEEVY
ncbi:alpha/beta fold hydrolase [Aquimarina sp. 2201CG1-2-11]|uniref:YheT family hydrolase n=1 Tax=Aquimarina discodermiae TaxID=3231043 RepID=UPI003462B50B